MTSAKIGLAHLDVVALLAAIRRQAVAQAAGAWPQLGVLVDNALSSPLAPFALLPLCSGLACGGNLEILKPIAANVALAALALRIIDDCADGDNPHALYLATGIGSAINSAAALSMTALQGLVQLPFPPAKSSHATPPPVANRPITLLPINVGDAYLHAYLTVCAGQDRDLHEQPQTLADYCAIVEAKTVAAYVFAVWLGARSVSSDPSLLLAIAACGMHLGWMVQMLDDIEALWFPSGPSDLAMGRLTFPVLYALALDHPAAGDLAALCQRPPYDEARIRALLDQMDVRRALIGHALDHRDQALATLDPPLLATGRTLLEQWLNWILRDGERLLHG